MAAQLTNHELDRLITGTAAGDTYAFEQLYYATSTAVYSYALSLLKNSYDAEDVLHDCFLRIHDAAAEYRPKEKAMAWILTITRNLCYKHLNSRIRQQELTDWQPDTTIEMPADDRIVLEACMAKLADDERQIVVLHAVAGFKHRQIAAFMDLPLSTVLSKYRRTIRKLRSYL